LHERRTGLAPCKFETVELDTCVGEVAGIDAEPLPERLANFNCRNNRLAHLGLRQDAFLEAVDESARRWAAARRRVSRTSTSGILETSSPIVGAIPARRIAP